MEEPLKRCPFCDELIRVNAVKCKHCGSLLSDVPVTVASDPTTAVRLALSWKYEILEEVGRGGMAVVYRARQKNLDRIVALKALPPQFTHDQEFLDRFHREARSGAKMHHPNIITVYDEGVEGGIHFMAMEFLEGIDLHRHIHQEGKLPVDETLQIITPIASALDYAHKNGIVHRDVKSSNIFLLKDGRPLLTDFGIAHATTGAQLTVSGTILGTPEFMSPEQASGKQVDERTDVYSLGVVLYHSLTGRLPYHGDSPLTTIYKILNERHEPLRKLVRVPGWIESLVERCLEKDVTRRIQSCAELHDLLRKHKGGAGHLPSLSPRTLKLGRDQAVPNPPPPVGEAKQSTVSSAKKRKPSPGFRLIAPVLSVGLIVAIVLVWPHSERPSKVRVPNIVGMSQVDARRTLKGVNLLAGSINTKAGLPGQKDLILGQVPESGAEVEGGSSVDLIIGGVASTPSTSITIPNVNKMSLDVARTTLRRLNLVVGNISSVPGPPAMREKVVRQIPKAGEKAEAGASVNLILGQ